MNTCVHIQAESTGIAVLCFANVLMVVLLRHSCSKSRYNGPGGD